MAMLFSKLPLSAKDLVRYTPDRYRNAEQKEAIGAALAEAQKLLEAAEGDEAKTQAGRRLAGIEAEAKRFENPPVYLLRVPTLQSRAAWKRDLAAEGADYPSNEVFFQALEDALKADGIEDADREPVQAAIDKQRTDPADKDSAKMVNAAIDMMGPHEPRLRALRARRVLWTDMAPLLAARHWLAGADVGASEPLMVKRGPGGIASEEALLAVVPSEDILACGWEAITLTEMDRPTAKN